MDVNTVIDLEWLKSATYADMKSVLNASSRHPEMVATLNALLSTPEGRVIAYEMINDPDYIPVSKRVLSPEDEAQRQLDLKTAEEQEAAAAAVESVVEAPVVEVPVVPVPEPIAEKKKIVIDYQATAEDGTPIGRPTHIEGWSWEEVSAKQRDAHVNAVRYAERVKRNKVQSIEAQTEIQQQTQKAQEAEQEANAAVQAAATEKDPAKLADAIRKVNKADRDGEDARKTAYERGRAIGKSWMADHKHDFQPCLANSKIINDWLTENNLVMSYENLELAFEAKRNELAKPVLQAPVQEAPVTEAPNASAVAPVAPAAAVVAPPAPIAPPAPAAAVPAAVPPSATPLVSQPAATAPSSTPAAAPIAQPAARRPGVNGGLQPGTLTAGRPAVVQNPQETSIADFRKQVDAMPAKEYRHKLTTSKQFRDQLRAAGIPVLGEEQYKTAR